MMTFQQQRTQMVDDQVAARGVTDQAILQAMRLVPREEFVPEHVRRSAYVDAPVPIEGGQTISQPFVVALMLDALELKGEDRALEIGSGSGYAAAVLSRIVAEVFAVERLQVLVDVSRERVRRLGYENIEFLHADGTLGWPGHAPYDAILVSAGGPCVPRSLLRQLKPRGRLVMPVGRNMYCQELVRVRRVEEDRYEREPLGGVQFVPLVGSEGWSDQREPASSRRAWRPFRILPRRRERFQLQDQPSKE
jgi:protein-L-isoaspartate(D-aspartate) O-methyltransferase